MMMNRFEFCQSIAIQRPYYHRTATITPRPCNRCFPTIRCRGSFENQAPPHTPVVVSFYRIVKVQSHKTKLVQRILMIVQPAANDNVNSTVSTSLQHHPQPPEALATKQDEKPITTATTTTVTMLQLPLQIQPTVHQHQHNDSDSTSQNNECNRTGRKGDPRMHKAVSARLEDPSISLFHALIKGGFDYERDDDPNLIDGEKVTLGQRKNQLSRRLRLAKKTSSSSNPTGISSTQPRHQRRKVDDALLSDDPAVSSPCHTPSSEPPPRMARDHPQFQRLLVRHNPNVVTSASSFTDYGTGIIDHHHASGVAVTELTNIAHSVGMTLEQLAFALSNHRQLAQALKGSFGRQELALAFFANNVRKVRTDALLQAGYPVEIACDETSEDYREFARVAWEQEGRNLKSMAKTAASGATHRSNHNHNLKDPPLEVPDQQPEPPPTKRIRSSSIVALASSVLDRHMHRLEGKCPHQAILHQPSNGPAHIDFVVGNRVECYQGVQPLPSHTNETRVWPSKYKCEDWHCAEECDKVKTADMQLHTDYDKEECTTIAEPKILNLDDIDIDGGEWITDFANDSSLLGLFKLGSATDGWAPESRATTDGEDSDVGKTM